MLRKFFVHIWFYFIPFFVLSLNFAIPYWVAKSREVVKSTVDEDYKEWI